MKKFLLGLCALIMIGFPLVASAATTAAKAAPANTTVSTNGDCPPNAAPGAVCLTNPLEGNPTDATVIIGRAIKAVLGLVGAIALIIFVRAGGVLLESRGNAEKVESGTKSMIWAAVGVVIVFASYFLLNLIIQFLTGQI